jgi:predicted MPP superfamily phosphohydrolase
MMDAFRILGGIKSKYGVFYVYGNHDIQNYSDNKTFTEAEHKQILEASGIRILRDEVYEINDEFVIAGRLDVSFERYTKEPRVSIDKLLENVDKSKFILTLDHQPNDYDKNKAAGTDLILSGHTHAGQIWPANFFLELFKFNDGVYGMERDEDGFNAIITSGIAGWGYTIKTSSPAEYVIVDIK